MNSRLRTAAAALGLTTICLAQMVEPLVRSDHASVYHWSGSPATLFGPVAVELAVLFVLLAGLLFSAEHQGWWRSIVWAGVILFLPWVIAHELETIWPNRVPHWFRMPPIYLALIALPLLCWWWIRKSRAREAAIEAASMVLAFTALSGVLFVSQFAWFWWQARGLNKPLPLHTEASGTVAARNPRIIWVIMDELSYRQVYGHRYAGVQLPAFDRLATESTVFTQVKPAANYTEVAVPALLSGKMISSVSATANGSLLVRAAKGERAHAFDETQTVFEDALQNGYRPAIAGWYNPYCRILHDVVDECYWADNYSITDGMVAESSFRSNLETSADMLLHAPSVRNPLQRFLHIPAELQGQTAEAHLDDYRGLRAAGDKLLNDPSLTFTFLHMPIPHPDGIYDRRKRQLVPGPSTYLDNLALADRYLNHLRTVLEKTGQWDSSVIVLMGDHGWRTTLVWEKSPEWTAEEQRASLNGTFDSRPAYIVKLAGQKTAQRVDTPFDARETRALMDELLAGRVRTADDLQTWVSAERAAR
jgi:type IV secretory pathway VirB2 component (pilin)